MVGRIRLAGKRSSKRLDAHWQFCVTGLDGDLPLGGWFELASLAPIAAVLRQEEIVAHGSGSRLRLRRLLVSTSL